MNNSLVFTNPSLTINNSHLYGGVTHTQNVNAETDLTIGTVASAELSFQTDLLNNSSLGKSFTYTRDSNRVGTFIVNQVTKVNDKYKVVAYDNLLKFDIIIDSWYEGLTFPITLQNMFSSLCSFCGCSTTGSITNGSMSIEKTFTSQNIKGKQILSYIAQCAGGYAYADTNGYIRIKGFTSSSITLDSSKYKRYEFADYTAPIIDKIWIGMEDSDAGYTYGSGDNVLRIIYNPLFFVEDITDYDTEIAAIYNIVHSYSYTPMRIELLEDLGINAGDIISVNNFQTLIMSKVVSSSGVVLESTGNFKRQEGADSTNSQITALRGKYNTLSRTVDETVNEVGDIAAGMATTVRIKPDGVTIADADGNTVVITGSCVDAATINANNLNMTGVITWSDLSSSAQTEINRLIAQSATYKQDTVPTNPTEGDAWYVTGNNDITVGNVTYYHHYTYTYNGSTWEQSGVPAYIKSTYIDFTQVQSPKLIGQDIDLQGGTFSIKDLTGVTQYGYLGYGSGIAGSSTIEDGVVLAQSSDTNLDVGDYYIICTSSGVRLCAGNWSLIVTDTGIYKQYNGGTMTPIGVAVFG